MSEAKQFDISKKAVIAAFQAVKENAGSYGADEQTIKEFEGGKAPFLCLEPWNGSGIFHQDDDIFAHKHGILTLESGKEKSYHLEISLIE